MEELNGTFNHNGDVLMPDADILLHASELPTKQEIEAATAAEALTPEVPPLTKIEQAQGWTNLSVKQRIDELTLLNAPFID